MLVRGWHLLSATVAAWKASSHSLCVQVQDDASRKCISTIAFFFRKAVVSLRVPSAFILAGATLFNFEKEKSGCSQSDYNIITQHNTHTCKGKSMQAQTEVHAASGMCKSRSLGDHMVTSFILFWSIGLNFMFNRLQPAAIRGTKNTPGSEHLNSNACVFIFSVQPLHGHSPNKHRCTALDAIMWWFMSLTLVGALGVSLEIILYFKIIDEHGMHATRLTHEFISDRICYLKRQHPSSEIVFTEAGICDGLAQHAYMLIRVRTRGRRGWMQCRTNLDL